MIGMTALGTIAGLGSLGLTHLIHTHQEWFGYDSSGEYGLPKKGVVIGNTDPDTVE